MIAEPKPSELLTLMRQEMRQKLHHNADVGEQHKFAIEWLYTHQEQFETETKARIETLEDNWSRRHEL